MNVIPTHIDWGISLRTMAELILCMIIAAWLMSVITKPLPLPFRRMLVAAAAVAGFFLWGNVFLD